VLGSGNKNHARSMPYPYPRFFPRAYRLPPIMPHPSPGRIRQHTPKYVPQTLQWRPVD
jgi:hypothetical protein